MTTSSTLEHVGAFHTGWARGSAQIPSQAWAEPLVWTPCSFDQKFQAYTQNLSRTLFTLKAQPMLSSAQKILSWAPSWASMKCHVMYTINRPCNGKWPGMAYRFTDISVMPIYRHFLKYRLSVSVKIRTDKISAIGYRLWPNIGYILVIFPRYICKTPIYRQLLEYRLSVSVKLRTDTISVIGNRLWSDIGNRLSAKFNRYAIPGNDPVINRVTHVYQNK